MAPLQVARLGWLPRQKLPLHDGWQRNELEKYATGHKMSYENRTKSGMTKIVLPGSWGCHHCKNDRGPPQNDTLGKVGPRYRHCNTHRGRLYFGMSFHLVPNFVRNSIKTAELPQHKPGSPSEHWWIPSSQLQSRDFKFCIRYPECWGLKLETFLKHVRPSPRVPTATRLE